MRAPVGVLCLALCLFGVLGQREPLQPVPTTPPPTYSRTYIILAPNTFHPSLPFSLSVSILSASSDVVVAATILKAGEPSDISIATVTGTFSPGTTELMTIQVPADETGSDYKLRIEGTGGLEFSQTQDLHFSPNSFSILVQTDKAIYKPGQTVHFRAMAIYPDLKPYTGSFDVQLKDPVGNIIQRWSDLVNADFGVVSGETVMSETPVLGDWVITVTANNQNYEHTITIDKYVLPKFEVIVTPPPYFTSLDTDATIQVEAKYTYGELVRGSVSLEVKLYDEKTYKVQFEINGKAETTLTKEELVALTNNNMLHPYYHQFTCTANVTETLTGIQQSGLGYFSYEERPIKVEELPGNPSVYKPGLTYTAYVTITHVDGTALTEVERRRKLVVTHSHYIGDWIDQIDSEVAIPENGILKLDFNYPTNSTSAKFYVAYYYGKDDENLFGYEVSKYLNSAKSPSNQYLQIVAQGTNYQAGSMANFIIRTTEVPPKLTYQIFSKGNIVLSRALTGITSTSTTLSFDVTSAMAPRARLVVSYIRSSNHELILDSVNINVEGAFENQVTVGFNKEEAEPGQDIKLDVTAEADSFVGVLAIDTSVALLKTGNDITQNQVIDALGAFDTVNSGRGDIDFGRPVFRKKRSARCCGWWPYPTPGQTAREVLRSAGILVFTDAHVYGEEQVWFARGGIMEDAELQPAMAEADGGPQEPKFKSSSANSPTAPKPRVRTEFPETWLWNDYVTGADGRINVLATVPDTITSWVASAFAMSAQKGLGVAESPAKVTVFRPFFVSLTLPYSVIRGEKLVLQVTVFNYMSYPVQATVTLTGSAEFQSLNYDENGSEKMSNTDQVTSVKVPANDGATVYFPILPQKLGMIDLAVRATTDKAGDAVVRQLLIEPEGIPTSFTEPLLIDLDKSGGALSKDFTFRIPKDQLVPGSVRSQLTVTGDIMGPTMSGLDKLLRLPNGCGEQTMVSFAPDVFIYSYLTTTNQNNPTVKQKAEDFMKTGYQRELTYKHTDHSFSAFGDRDPSGSTWLTAFVIKCFSQAKPFIYIDSKVIQNSVEWLIRQQTIDGDFEEPGRVIHTDMQGGVSSASTMTAYVLITLKEVQMKTAALGLPQTFWDNVDRSANLATNFLERRYASISNDVYALAIVTYALTLSESSRASQFLGALETLAVVEDGIKYWKDPRTANEEVDRWTCFYYPPPSADIEMTGYTLLTYLALDKIADGASIARWLADQRNEYGGYGSTQDTVIGLQALSSYASVLSVNPRNIVIDVTATEDPSYSSQITVTDDNSIILQKVELPVTSGTVQTSVTGTGTCLMQFTAFYNLNEVLRRPSFELTVTMVDVDKNTVTIVSCGRYVGGNDATGMSMLEVGLPSGFYADEDSLNTEVSKQENLVKYEIGKRTVYLYLNGLNRNTEYCFSVMARRDKIVANLKPSNAVIYDYYKPGDQTVVSYSSKSLSKKSICDTCPICCGMDPGNGSQRITAGILVIAAMTLLALFN